MNHCKPKDLERMRLAQLVRTACKLWVQKYHPKVYARIVKEAKEDTE